MDPAAAPEHSRSIALCLSGGGLRATFFHLGVIDALHRCGRLKEVKEVFSVSGGSITAAHLALNWKRYTGSEEDFRQATDELRAIGEWDIRGRVLRRWILSCAFVMPRLLGYGRTELLQRQYEQLTKKARLRDIAPDITGGPRFYFLSTSFNTGDLCSFSHDHFVVHRQDEPVPLRYPSENVRLSLAVAASSAFPPMFPPLRLTWDQLGGASEGGFSTIALTDGGVYDNLGYDKLATLAKEPGRVTDGVILSDAGGAFSDFVNHDFSGLISRNVRATDILMRRTAHDTLARAKSDAAINKNSLQQRDLVYASIATSSVFSRLSATIQTRMQNIRTDLDRFSKQEVDLLVEHGRAVAQGALAEQGLWQDAAQKEAESNETSQQRKDDAATDFQSELYERSARKAGQRRIGLLNSQDWTSEILVVLTACLVFSVGYFADRSYEWYKWYRGQLERASQVEYLEQRVDSSRKEIADLQQVVESSRTQNASLTILLAQAKTATGAPPTGQNPPAEEPPKQQPIDPKQFTVWIQFAGSLSREEMINFGKRIGSLGWNAPGATRGGERTGNAAGLNEVRFGPGTDPRAADELAKAVNQTHVVPTEVKPRLVSIIPRNSLEIWISN